MGLLRLILAIAVLLGHASDHAFYGFRLVYGVRAVEAFFMLSGFYMALVLDHTYRGQASYRVFLENRIMRLYPMYWLILALTVPLVLVSTRFVELPRPRPDVLGFLAFVFPQLLAEVPSLLLRLLSQATIIGEDVLYALYALTAGPPWNYGIGDSIAPAAVQGDSLPAFERFLFVPQAWSLGLEMLFYAMAPFLVRRSTLTIVVLMAASLGLRAWMFGAGLTYSSTWAYKFFPNEFWTFAAGILMYRAYRLIETRNYPTMRLIWAPAALAGVGLFSVYVPLLGGWLFFAAIAILVPVAFRLFDNRHDLGSGFRGFIRADRFLGDLSYPVYLSHVFVLAAMYTFFPRMTPGLGSHLTPTFVAVTLVFSAFLLRFVGEPIDRLRARNSKRLGRAPDAATRRPETTAEQGRAKRKAATP